MIRLLGTPDGYTTQVFERAHVDYLKNYYGRTNKHADYLEQILRHDIGHANMNTMRDTVNYRDTEAVPHTRQRTQEEEKRTEAGNALNLTALGWPAIDEESVLMKQVYGCDGRYWRQAGAIAKWLQLDNFLEALAAFIRPDWTKTAEHDPSKETGNIYIREADCDWVRSYPVRVHANLKCWKVLGEDSRDMGRLYIDIVVCRPTDNGWRRDCVWLHDRDAVAANFANMSNSRKLVGQVQAVVEVKDLGRRDFKQRPTRLQGAFVEVFNYRHSGQVQECHGMVEVERARPFRSTEFKKPWEPAILRSSQYPRGCARGAWDGKR